MKIVRHHSELSAALEHHRQQGRQIALVPTMGALHAGHLSLIEEARKENDVLVASIFVNPTQFNNPDDFAAYPQTPEADVDLLQRAGVDFLYLPDKTDIYSADYEPPVLDLGIYDQVMEGKFRPGHFKGVVQVVYRLFDLVKPNRAYFGLKDYQQVAVIRRMTQHFGMPVQLIACPTIRETDGLALSSRNLRLTADQRRDALFIYDSLRAAQEMSENHSPDAIREAMQKRYAEGPLQLEYFEIIDPQSFESLHETWVPGAVACVVAYCGEVRLIDNMVLRS